MVGAGISGLTCARELIRRGHTVTVFEKSRGAGGRASTRRRGGWRFDHGAQYFTARDARFADRVAEWQRRGVVAAWRGRIVEARADGKLELKSGTPRYVGVPGMSQLGRDLASAVNDSCGDARRRYPSDKLFAVATDQRGFRARRLRCGGEQRAGSTVSGTAARGGSCSGLLLTATGVSRA